LIEYVHPELLPKLTLEIAKPNRTIIGRLKDAFNRKSRIKLGQINEIDFVVPYMTFDNEGNQTKNPMIDKLRSQYHIKATFGDQVEWFVVSNLQKATADDGKSFLTVQLKSLGYQLKNKKLKTWAGVYLNGEFVKESLNAQVVLNDLLSGSVWSVSYIDSEFLTKYRSFDFSGTTVLDAIFNVAETFGAIIQWDTVNKSISLVKQENVGINKGFRISERKYLKSIDKEEKSDEIVTRLKVYGKDGLSINRVNPLGTDYIEDLSYFMQGFQRDANKNVLSSSLYMTDDLCNALLDYQSVIQSNKGSFDSLLSQKETYEAQYITKDTELVNLETQLKTVLNAIDLKQSTGSDASAELAQKVSLEGQIATKKSEIAAVISQINGIDTQIKNLKTTLSVEHNLTAAQIIELDDYIIEEEWEDQNYTNDLELYNDAQKVFDDLKKPKEIISTNIINIFKLLEGKQDWKKVVIGDKFYIDYERFGIDVETQLIELEIDHDGLDINVTFANTKDIERDEDKLAKLLYGSISTGNRVNMNKYKWDQVNNVKTSVDDILNNKWDAAKREIVAGVNETVTIDSRGLTITDSSDPLKFVRATNSVIGLTRDGGNTFKTAISPEGVYAEQLVGKIVITENLYIENESGNYVFDGNGFVITSTDEKKRVVLDVDNGLKFQTKVGTGYVDKLYYDSNDDILKFDGEGDFKELKVKGQSVLTGDKSKISGNFIDSITTNQLVAGTAKITSAMIDTVTAEQIKGGTITGVTVNVDTDLKVGNNIYLGSLATDGQAKRLWFNNQANITGGTGVFGASVEISCDELILGGQVDFQNITPKNLNITVSFG
jgi:hypothetical protein